MRDRDLLLFAAVALGVYLLYTASKTQPAAAAPALAPAATDPLATRTITNAQGYAINWAPPSAGAIPSVAYDLPPTNNFGEINQYGI